jgi:Ulp1 family protease
MYGVMRGLARYIELEARDKKGQLISTRRWSKVCATHIPVQTDGHSCGLYALVFVHCLARGGSLAELASCGISRATAVAVRANLMCQLVQVWFCRQVGAYVTSFGTPIATELFAAWHDPARTC